MHCITAVFSSTEESGVVPKGTEVEIHGSKGAYVAARYLKPDFAFVVDSCVSSDIPGIPEKDVMVRLKRGPVLRVIDEYTIMRPAVRKFIMKILEEAGISYQVGFSATYTDASVIQLMDVPVAVVGIPIRYIHFPCQIISSEDLENTVNLLVHSLLTIDSTPDFKKNLEY